MRYHSSQPWPFPQSLMLGFTAAAAAAAPQLAGLDALGVHLRCNDCTQLLVIVSFDPGATECGI